MSRRIMAASGVTAAVLAIGAIVLAMTVMGRGDQATTSAGDVRLLEGGGITVQAALRPRSGQALEFEIFMDTHSVDLKQFDLAEMSRVLLGGDQSLTGGTWTIKGKADSHHLGGTLVFEDAADLVNGARTVVLEIEGLPGEPVRRFEWQGAAQ